MSVSQSQDVVFWVSREQGYCRWNAEPFPKYDQRMISNGGVCAYQEDIDRTFVCPAPDRACWYFRDSCTGSLSNGSLLPGNDQRLCTNPVAVGDANKAWCCSNETTCPTASSSWNICLGSWRSPMSGLNSADAYALMSSVLGTTTIGTATILSNAPVFTALTVTPVDASGARATSLGSSQVSPIATSSQSSLANSASLTASNSNPGSASAKSSSLSGGAIAGIVIGILAALLLVLALFFYIGRIRRRSSQKSDTATTSMQNRFDTPQRPEEKQATAHLLQNEFANHSAEIMSHERPIRNELP